MGLKSLKLIAEDFIDPLKVAEVLPLYEALVVATREEPGCIHYELCQDLKNLGHFLFIEEWRDEAALDAHIASDHFQTIVPKIDQYALSEGRFTHMSKIL